MNGYDMVIETELKFFAKPSSAAFRPKNLSIGSEVACLKITLKNNSSDFKSNTSEKISVSSKSHLMNKPGNNQITAGPLNVG